MSHGTVHDDGGSEDGYGARRADKLGLIRRFNNEGVYLFVNRRRRIPFGSYRKYRYRVGDAAFFHVDRDEHRDETGTASRLFRFNLLKLYYLIARLFIANERQRPEPARALDELNIGPNPCGICETGIVAYNSNGFIIIIQTHRPDSGTPVPRHRHNPYTIMLNFDVANDQPDVSLVVGSVVEYVREKRIIDLHDSTEEVWSARIIRISPRQAEAVEVARQWRDYYEIHEEVYRDFLQWLNP